MKNIQKIDRWKEEENKEFYKETYLGTDIVELNLSARSFNCLKRAGCHTIGDIEMLIGEDGSELRKVKNLEKGSEEEILEKLEELRKEIKKKVPEKEAPKTVLVKPKKNVWNESIESFRISERSLLRLRECGIETVKDLYATNPKMEPGWYAVRELFSKIAMR